MYVFKTKKSVNLNRRHHRLNLCEIKFGCTENTFSGFGGGWCALILHLSPKELNASDLTPAAHHVYVLHTSEPMFSDYVKPKSIMN